jgi:hypothetical protein
MLPPTPMNDVPNRSTGDPEMGGQGLDQFALRTALSDGQDLLFGQLGRRVGIPTRDKFGMQSPEIPVAVAMPTLGNHVVGVVLSRPQEEVGRIDACSIVAMVQNPQATGDRAEVQSPKRTDGICGSNRWRGIGRTRRCSCYPSKPSTDRGAACVRVWDRPCRRTTRTVRRWGGTDTLGSNGRESPRRMGRCGTPCRNAHTS